jgi:hypothetical protein
LYLVEMSGKRLISAEYKKLSGKRLWPFGVSQTGTDIIIRMGVSDLLLVFHLNF